MSSVYASQVVCYPRKKKYYTITKTFLDCRTEINEDDTKHLNLHGRQLDEMIGRRMNDNDLDLICEYITEDPSIVSVELCYNDITDEGMSKIATLLKNNTSIKYLDLMMNNFGEEGLKKLTALKNSLSVSALRINGNKFGRNGGINLAAFLDINYTVEHLDIAETDQTVTSFVHIMSVLHHNKSLKCLDISRVLGFPHYVLDIDHIIQVLYQMLVVNRTLVELHLQKMEITDFVLDILTEALQINNTLLLLDLACNQIGDHGAEHIGNFLKKNPPLQALMLNHNRIRNTGATYLSYAIAFSNLRFLDIAHNCIGEEGVTSLLYTVRKSPNLIVLFLWNNSVVGKALHLLELWLKVGVLQKSALDVNVYRDEFGQLSAYNSQADVYKNKYYSVNGKVKRRRRVPKPGINDLAFMYHNIVHIWEIPKVAQFNDTILEHIK